MRRRDLIGALRSRREQMLATLKRDGRSANRFDLHSQQSFLCCNDLSYGAAMKSPADMRLP